MIERTRLSAGSPVVMVRTATWAEAVGQGRPVEITRHPDHECVAVIQVWLEPGDDRPVQLSFWIDDLKYALRVLEVTT